MASNVCRDFLAGDDSLKTELVAETPIWILSSFGAAKYEPNLITGYDLQPEELRWKSVVALKEGRAQDYVREEEALLEHARTTIRSAYTNLAQTKQRAEVLHDARFPPGSTVGGDRPPEFSEARVLEGMPTNTHSNSLASRMGGSGGGGAGGAFGSSSFGASGGGAFGSSAFGQGQKTAGAFGAKPGPSVSAFGASTTPSGFGA
ncbi:hypothetical protein P7C73_g6156, partial [Tremellales sp. Uapishka_1]